MCHQAQQKMVFYTHHKSSHFAFTIYTSYTGMSLLFYLGVHGKNMGLHVLHTSQYQQVVYAEL